MFCKIKYTVFKIKIQTVINNRPLTFLYDGPAEEVLIPNGLLFGRKINLEIISKNISFQ